MSVGGWQSILVLGGIRSGKSDFAESLITGDPMVRYVATGAADPSDAEWLARIGAHRARRPADWHTDEATGDPGRLIEAISSARADETLLVDDLGGWVAALLDPTRQPADDRATIAELCAAVRSCPARLVLVSPEVGLALVPSTPVGRAFADALGSTNQLLAEVSDAVVLVVAGQPVQLKSTGPAATATVTSPEPQSQAGPEPAATNGSGAAAQIAPGMTLPMPAEKTRTAGIARLGQLDLPGAGFGALENVIGFAAGTQDATSPQPWDQVQVVLVHGDHEGGVAAGDSPQDSARRADQARAGHGALARLAATAGAVVDVVAAPVAAPIEHQPALTPDEVNSALATGWEVAQRAGRAGVAAIVIAACGAGGAAAAAAVVAATTGAEPAALLGRVSAAGGKVDDAAWMSRCAAVRDALHRTRRGTRGAREVLAEYAGGDVAVATGVLLGATANRIPVLLDGPVGVAAALVSRDLAGQTRHWCLLPDHGRQPTVRHAADVLGLTPLLDLRLDLGEGATALAALPLLRSTLALADTLGEHPTFAEPEPAGPGPAAAGPAAADPVR
ncbi:bifunctional adenosylcobinamide kinase/adenosylcobinamide-phosphate guanylyltransferase [Solwaraspora sp. WMMA2080]|uniref:bifunctional adenosylcobinamide kinase/adenosylcobinamide-phosphate guanylyltransferase n=1 Tax=unclassified Solwaraspora TaxID=2627926 RepID=UPI00248CC1B0|nr:MULTISPECIES: bifunctional adenosylcobinamide kinase/adenosylcobinamide-phosphate guanylyltransferase [unclassified Solwaraspora]WBB95158.1 bifunctional adenosylcobinamide kinase/adenosylcobinamide-phosphate guanylyltransferase [Solwaraspora sp. WMMA2059]WBC20958.1 bifunctional adenosylcobinamide kinase/adenosylcobinamide-phosphate guanylyltransferase [Solwaraspora sp. WMMA2080]